MTEVHNWQIGRTMNFPGERTIPKRQFAFVFNTNRCIGCQSCSLACKSTWTFSKGQEHMWWNNVETKPYGGYPRNWDAKLLEMLDAVDSDNRTWTKPEGKDPKAPYGKFNGKTIFEAVEKNPGPDGPQAAMGYLPTDEEWTAPNIFGESPTGYKGGAHGLSGAGAALPEHQPWFFYLQRICNHCSSPSCVAACPRHAIYKRPEDGIVLINEEECRGYKRCIEACPYKKIMHQPTTRVSEKCNGCHPRIEGGDPLSAGEPMEAGCMTACVGQIRLQGLVDINPDGQWKEDRYNPIYYLVKVAQVALPLYPQFGTEPNGFYIPPRWAPRDYLKQMFGPGVDAAIAKYSAPDRETLAVLNLFRRSQKVIFQYRIEEGPKISESMVKGRKVELYNDTVIALDQHGKEMFRTTIEEKPVVRAAKHPNTV